MATELPKPSLPLKGKAVKPLPAGAKVVLKPKLKGGAPGGVDPAALKPPLIKPPLSAAKPAESGLKAAVSMSKPIPAVKVTPPETKLASSEPQRTPLPAKPGSVGVKSSPPGVKPSPVVKETTSDAKLAGLEPKRPALSAKPAPPSVKPSTPGAKPAAPGVKLPPPGPKPPAPLAKPVSVVGEPGPVGYTAGGPASKSNRFPEKISAAAPPSTQNAPNVQHSVEPGGLSNLQTLTHSFKDTVSKRGGLASEQGHAAKERLVSYASERFRFMEPHIRLHEALEVLNDITASTGAQPSLQASEFCRKRGHLRRLMLRGYADGRFSDALAEALSSLELSRAFYTVHTGQGLTGDMALELLLICRLCGLSSQLEEGQKYLDELRYLVESTVRSAVQRSGAQPQELRGDKTFPNAVLKCDGGVVCQLLEQLAEVCSLLRQPQLADSYYDKLIMLVDTLYPEDSLKTADTRNAVALYYFKTRRYERALQEAESALETRRSVLGDFWRIPPHPRVAESYANVGILRKLTGRPEDALSALYTALDMQMRINRNDRNTEAVQDVLLCIGVLHHQLAQFRQALELYTEVLRFRREQLGPEHADTAHVQDLLQRYVGGDDVPLRKYGCLGFVLLIIQLEEDIRIAERAAFQYEIPASPRGTRDGGIFFDGLFGPGVIAKRTRAALLRTSLTHGNLDDFRHKKPFWLDTITTRMRALYGEDLRALSVPSTAIHPFVFTETLGPDILALSAALDRIGTPDEPERASLPVINIPSVEHGLAKLKAPEFLTPEFTANTQSTDLFKEWGLQPCTVDVDTGAVQEPVPNPLPEDLPMALPLWDTRFNAPMRGIDNKPLLVPNPGVAHLLYTGVPSSVSPKIKAKSAEGETRMVSDKMRQPASPSPVKVTSSSGEVLKPKAAAPKEKTPDTLTAKPPQSKSLEKPPQKVELKPKPQSTPLKVIEKPAIKPVPQATVLAKPVPELQKKPLEEGLPKPLLKPTLKPKPTILPKPTMTPLKTPGSPVAEAQTALQKKENIVLKKPEGPPPLQASTKAPLSGTSPGASLGNASSAASAPTKPPLASVAASKKEKSPAPPKLIPPTKTKGNAATSRLTSGSAFPQKVVPKNSQDARLGALAAAKAAGVKLPAGISITPPVSEGKAKSTIKSKPIPLKGKKALSSTESASTKALATLKPPAKTLKGGTSPIPQTPVGSAGPGLPKKAFVSEAKKPKAAEKKAFKFSKGALFKAGNPFSTMSTTTSSFESLGFLDRGTSDDSWCHRVSSFCLHPEDSPSTSIDLQHHPSKRPFIQPLWSRSILQNLSMECLDENSDHLEAPQTRKGTNRWKDHKERLWDFNGDDRECLPSEQLTSVKWRTTPVHAAVLPNSSNEAVNVQAPVSFYSHSRSNVRFKKPVFKQLVTKLFPNSRLRKKKLNTFLLEETPLPGVEHWANEVATEFSKEAYLAENNDAFQWATAKAEDEFISGSAAEDILYGKRSRKHCINQRHGMCTEERWNDIEFDSFRTANSSVTSTDIASVFSDDVLFVPTANEAVFQVVTTVEATKATARTQSVNKLGKSSFSQKTAGSAKGLRPKAMSAALPGTKASSHISNAPVLTTGGTVQRVPKKRSATPALLPVVTDTQRPADPPSTTVPSSQSSMIPPTIPKPPPQQETEKPRVLPLITTSRRDTSTDSSTERSSASFKKRPEAPQTPPGRSPRRLPETSLKPVDAKKSSLETGLRPLPRAQPSERMEVRMAATERRPPLPKHARDAPEEDPRKPLGSPKTVLMKKKLVVGPVVGTMSRPLPDKLPATPPPPIFKRKEHVRPPHVPLDILKKAKAVKPGFESVFNSRGVPTSLPCVTLVDENGNDLINLPWRVDLNSLLMNTAAASHTLSRYSYNFPELKFLGKGPPDVFDVLRAGAGLAALTKGKGAFIDLVNTPGGPALTPMVAGAVYPQQFAGMAPTTGAPYTVPGPERFGTTIGGAAGFGIGHYPPAAGGPGGDLLLGPGVPVPASVAGWPSSPQLAFAKEGAEKTLRKDEKKPPPAPGDLKAQPSAKGPEAAKTTGPESAKEAGKKGPPAGKKGPPSGKKGPPGGKKPPLPSGAKKPAFGAKKEAGPPSKTKKLFWDPIADPGGTIWESKEALGINIGDIETVFAKSAPKAAGDVKREQKPKVIQILPDGKRSYNMSIALSRFNNYTFAQLRDAILDLTPEILTADATDTLITFAPLPEENTVVEEYIKSGADLKLLDKPEQFVAAMLGLPFFKQRLESHRFALQFLDNYDAILAPLDHMMQAIQQLRSSKCLKSILTVALDIGNEMNKGSEISGFKLSTLNKLNDVKTVTKPIRSVLQYIVDVIYEQRPELLLLQKEIPAVERAARTDLSIVETNLQQLDAGLKKVKNVVEMARKKNLEAGALGDKDPMPDILAEFLQEAEPKVLELQESVKEIKSRFRQTAIFFGESEKTVDKIKPEALFADIAKFSREVEATRKDRQEKAEREAKRLAAKAKPGGPAKAGTEKSAPKEPQSKLTVKKPPDPVATPTLKTAIGKAALELKSSTAMSKGKSSTIDPTWFDATKENATAVPDLLETVDQVLVAS